MTTDRRADNSGAAAPVSKQERLRFHSFSLDRTRAGRVTCAVTLEYGPGEQITAESTGQASPAGDTRLGAEAAIKALEAFTEGTIKFELIGVKVVRVFDANVVIASLMQHGDSGPERLLGCYLAEGDLVRGAALSVLNATNRVLGTYFLTR